MKLRNWTVLTEPRMSSINKQFIFDREYNTYCFVQTPYQITFRIPFAIQGPNGWPCDRSKEASWSCRLKSKHFLNWFYKLIGLEMTALNWFYCYIVGIRWKTWSDLTTVSRRKGIPNQLECVNQYSLTGTKRMRMKISSEERLTDILSVHFLWKFWNRPT